MRIIKKEQISDCIRDLFIKANTLLPPDCESLIYQARDAERDSFSKNLLGVICKNLECAKEKELPICQDTGMAVVFADVGIDVKLDCPLCDSVNDGVARAYLDGCLRKSVVSDPLFLRENTGDNTPAILHTNLVPGDKITFQVAPKGFGSENMSAIKMFSPSINEDDIIAFVVDTVKNAGANPCPPVLIGIGIGGDFEYCAELSKRALLRDVSKRNENVKYRQLEERILGEVNKLNIGTQGVGGNITALEVNIEFAPTHIASVPCAVNISCHVMRHASAVI